MKNLCCLFAFALMVILIPFRSHGQAQEMQQLLLNIEKLTQLKSILSDMKTGYEIYNTGYGAISGFSKGNFDLHDNYLGSLFKISPAVKGYARIGEIISQQRSLVREYQMAYSRFRASGHFSAAELAYFGKVYGKLVKESLLQMEELTNVTFAGKLRMSDAERIEAIDRIYEISSGHLVFLRHFNRQGAILSLRRAQDTKEVLGMQKVYGFHP